MATEAKDDMEMAEEEGPITDVLDEYQMAFDAAVEAESSAMSEEASIAAYSLMLASDRVDELAVKVKEQCMYK